MTKEKGSYKELRSSTFYKNLKTKIYNLIQLIYDRKGLHVKNNINYDIMISYFNV